MIPAPYELLLLSLAAFRLVRLIGWDSITEKLRARLTGWDDAAAPEFDEEMLARWPAWRVYLSTLIRCPWCIGSYVSLLVYAAWLAADEWTLAVCVPLTLSAIVGLVAKQLDP